jgi:hypothetical protein
MDWLPKHKNMYGIYNMVFCFHFVGLLFHSSELKILHLGKYLKGIWQDSNAISDVSQNPI